jgi:hypothetical protein
MERYSTQNKPYFVMILLTIEDTVYSKGVKGPFMSPWLLLHITLYTAITVYRALLHGLMTYSTAIAKQTAAVPERFPAI